MPVLQQDPQRANKLLMHIDLSPQEGNRNMIIGPKMHRNDTPKDKWVKILLRMKGNMPELRLQPKKYRYRYQPIVKTTSRDRRCRQDSKRKQQGGQQEQQETRTCQEQDGHQPPAAETETPKEDKSMEKQQCKTRPTPEGHPQMKGTCQPETDTPGNNADKNNRRQLQ